jgi:hypothetical protein
MANRFIIAGALLALISIPALVTGLRKGRVHLRGPYGRMDRRRQPIRFWSSVAVTGLAANIRIGNAHLGGFAKTVSKFRSNFEPGRKRLIAVSAA